MKTQITRKELMIKIEKQEVRVTEWITDQGGNRLKVNVLIMPFRKPATWEVI